MNQTDFQQITNQIAGLIRQRGEAEVALKQIKRELEIREMQLISERPPDGKSEDVRKTQRALLFSEDGAHATYSAQAFEYEITIARCAVEIEALEKQYGGMRWETRARIIDRLPVGESRMGLEYRIDTEYAIDGSIERALDNEFKKRPVPTGGELERRMNRTYDRLAGIPPAPPIGDGDPAFDENW